MAHIDSIGAGLFTSLGYVAGTTLPVPGDADATDTSDLTFTDIPQIREFPEFGTPANIVNVPVYGQAISSQIQGQADATALEFTLNYNPAMHNAVQDLVEGGVVHVFRIRLANTELPSTLTALTEVDDFYVLGTFAGFVVSPNLTDSNQATLTIATQGDFVGPFTTA